MKGADRPRLPPSSVLVGHRVLYTPTSSPFHCDFLCFPFCTFPSGVIHIRFLLSPQFVYCALCSRLSASTSTHSPPATSLFSLFSLSPAALRFPPLFLPTASLRCVQHTRASLWRSFRARLDLLFPHLSVPLCLRACASRLLRLVVSTRGRTPPHPYTGTCVQPTCPIDRERERETAEPTSIYTYTHVRVAFFPPFFHLALPC